MGEVIAYLLMAVVVAVTMPVWYRQVKSHGLALTGPLGDAARWMYRTFRPQSPASPTPQDKDDEIDGGDGQHVLIVGRTGSGKSSFARHYIDAELRRRARVIICDPEGDSWPLGCEMVGAPDNFPAIVRVLRQVQQEATERRRAFIQGKRRFRPLTVLLDEAARTLRNAPDSLPIIDDLVRRGRKLSISVVLLSQDTQVKTLGLAGQSALLQNFHRITVRRDGDGVVATLNGNEQRVPLIGNFVCVPPVIEDDTEPVSEPATPIVMSNTPKTNLVVSESTAPITVTTPAAPPKANVGAKTTPITAPTPPTPLPGSVTPPPEPVAVVITAETKIPSVVAVTIGSDSAETVKALRKEESPKVVVSAQPNDSSDILNALLSTITTETSSTLVETKTMAVEAKPDAIPLVAAAALELGDIAHSSAIKNAAQPISPAVDTTTDTPSDIGANITFNQAILKAISPPAEVREPSRKVIAVLLAAGWSANMIATELGGNRNKLLAIVREVREQLQVATSSNEPSGEASAV